MSSVLSVLLSCSSSCHIAICQESFNDLKKIFTFDQNKNNHCSNALYFILLSAVRDWHWEWFYNLDLSVFLIKTLTLTYIRFHSIHFLLLIFPFLTWECKLLAVKMCRFPPALPVAARHVPIPRTGYKILCDKGWLKIVCSLLRKKNWLILAIFSMSILATKMHLNISTNPIMSVCLWSQPP